MNKGNIQKFLKLFSSIIIIYFLISIFFMTHFFFKTEINGVDLSLVSYKDALPIIGDYVNNYELQIIGRNGETDIIIGQNIDLQYNENYSMKEIYEQQKAFSWISSLFHKQEYYEEGLFTYHRGKLTTAIERLLFLNKDMVVEPKNVRFIYVNGSYHLIEEVYGNKINKDILEKAIIDSLGKGKQILILEEEDCYEKPEFTTSSQKTLETRKLLNQYISSKIIYNFGDQKEILDGSTLHKWLKLDENLDIIINRIAVTNYVKRLSQKYDTVGISRNFKTSTGKVIEIEGGLYGWKINQEEEIHALLEEVTSGKVIEKEPIYSQKALYRGEDEIGNTYVEVSITRQHLWYYKNGELIAHGNVVTGNPNRGYATVVGAYMLNYKQNNAILTGPGYEVMVKYWMPFFGNMGIHDASWRSSFGGEIYKRNGTHGCINAPPYLAKLIFENIEAGTPVIIYEE